MAVTIYIYIGQMIGPDDSPNIEFILRPDFCYTCAIQAVFLKSGQFLLDLTGLHISLVDLPRPPFLLRVLKLTVVSVCCFESSKYCIGMDGVSKVFLERGELEGSREYIFLGARIGPQILRGFKCRRAIPAGSFNR